MPASPLHLHSVCGLNSRQLAPEWTLGDTGAIFKPIFMCFCILEGGIPSSADHLRVDFCGNVTTASSTNPQCRPPVNGLPVPGLSFMLPVAKLLCSHRRSVCLGTASWQNRCWKSSRSWFTVFPVGESSHGYWRQPVIQLCNCSLLTFLQG